MRNLLASFLIVLACAVGAFAQDAPATMQPGRTYLLQFDHEGEPDVRFRLWLNGQKVKDFAPGEVTKGAAVPGATTFHHTFQFTAPAAPGMYVIGVSAFAPVGGKEVDSAPATLGVSNDRTSAPSAPKNLIIRVQVNVEIKPGG